MDENEKRRIQKIERIRNNNSNRETKSLKLTKTEKSTSNIDGIFCVEQIIDDNNTSARVYAPFPFLFETFDDAELRKERLNDVWDETNKIKAITRARVITEVLQSEEEQMLLIMIKENFTIL